LVTRLDTSGLALRAIPKHPLMGIGYGGKAMAKVYEDARELREADHPHDLFIEVTLGIGIPGLIILVWIFSAMLRGTLGEMAKASDGLGQALLLGLGMAVVGVIVSNLFDHIFAGGMAHLFWVLIALAMGVNAAQERWEAGAGSSGSWRLAA
jgi:O-antigen ligase